MNYKKTYHRAIDEIRESVTTKAPSRAPRRIALSAGLVATGIVAAFLLTAIPRQADAATIDRMASALGSAETYHLTMTYNGPGGTRMERWKDGNRKRYIFGDESGPSIDRAYDGRRVWSIQYRDKMARIKTEDPAYFGDEKAPTVEKIISEFRRYSKGADRVTHAANGDKQTIVLTKKGGSHRVEIQVDRQYRPLEISYQAKGKSGQWVTTTVTKIEYPASLGDDVFQFTPPTGFRLYDVDKNLTLVKNALRGGQQQTVSGVTVRLACAVQQTEGNVYVFWTGGGAPPYLAKAAASTPEGQRFYTDMFAAAFNPDRPLPKMDKNRVYPAEGDYIGIYPLMTYQGNPVYALHVVAGSYAGPLKVTIPVCKPVKPYIQQVGKSVKHRATGVQVGTATFEVTPIQIEHVMPLVEQLDPSSKKRFTNHALEQIGLTKEEQTKLANEAIKIQIEAREWPKK